MEYKYFEFIFILRRRTRRNSTGYTEDDNRIENGVEITSLDTNFQFKGWKGSFHLAIIVVLLQPLLQLYNKAVLSFLCTDLKFLWNHSSHQQTSFN